MELARDSWLRATIKTEQLLASFRLLSLMQQSRKTQLNLFSTITFPREMRSRLQGNFGLEVKRLVCLKSYFVFILSYQDWYIQARPFSEKYCAN